MSKGNHKVPKADYADSGLLAVVDQGDSDIAGYVDTMESAFQGSTPVIVFGDHTRRFKFVDFPFAMGADGVKVLAANDGVAPRYLFHYLRSVDIPFAGYSRHFKFLKGYQIPLPPLEEQRRIARVLDAADALRAKRRESLDQLSEVTQAAFTSLTARRTDEDGGWYAGPLSELVPEIRIGPFGSALHRSDYVVGGAPVINPMHIRSAGGVCPDPEFSVGPKKKEELVAHLLRPGDVVLGRRGEIGRCAVVREDQPDMICGTGSMALRPNRVRLSPTFLQALLSSPQVRRGLEAKSSGVTMANLTKSHVANLPVSIPPMHVQERFDEITAVAFRLLGGGLEHLTHLNALFSSLQSRAFAGEL